MLYPKYELYCTGISYILKSNETNYDMSKKIIIEDEDDGIPDVIFGAVEEKVKRKPENYVDNKKFFAEMITWKAAAKECRDTDDPIPPVSEYIAMCFFKIAENLAKKPNFVNYQFKEDMIGDGIENCLQYCENFDPKKSNNPFSYFTQIIYYAFLRKIQKEKKQNLIKYKYLNSLDIKGDFHDIIRLMGITEDEGEYYRKITEETVIKKKQIIKKKRKKKTKLFEDED